MGLFACLVGSEHLRLFEVVTMTQLRIHLKPVGLLNTQGFYDLLMEFLDRAVSEGFIRKCHRPLLVSDTSIPGLIRKMDEIVVPKFEDWL